MARWLPSGGLGGEDAARGFPELVPITARQRWVGALRVAIAATACAAALTGATPLAVAGEVLVAVSALYVVGLLAVQEAVRRQGYRGTAVMGAALLIDGVYVVWVLANTDGLAGVGPLLTVFHIVGVTLLLSYRTGVKLAVWHALLAYTAFELHTTGVVQLAGFEELRFGWLVAYVVVLGVVAVGTASFSAVNERELRRRRADLEALAALATELEGVETPDEVAAVLAERVRDNFPFSQVAVVGGTDATRVLAAAGLETPPAELAPAGPHSVIRRACRERRTQLLRYLDPGQDPGLAQVFAAAPNVVVVCLPSDDATLQAVVAEHGLRRGSRIEGRVITALERFTDHAGLALRAAKLLQDMHTLAVTDTLTGTATRRVFEDTLPTELSRAIRTDDAFALLLLDVDHFKPVNDTYGHQTGDEILRGIAQRLMATSRDFDLVARYGGEEFVVLAPGCGERAGVELAERLRVEIETAPLAVPVTISIGVAVGPLHATTAEDLIARADDALFTAKRTGRNRVILAPEQPRKRAGTHARR